VRTTWIGALFGTAMLAGCFDSATQQGATKDLVVKLSKEEEQLLDAMAFLFSVRHQALVDLQGTKLLLLCCRVGGTKGR
jgi:hypothetical protein